MCGQGLALAEPPHPTHSTYPTPSQAYWLTCTLAAGGLLKARTFGLPYGSKLFRLGAPATYGSCVAVPAATHVLHTPRCMHPLCSSDITCRVRPCLPVSHTFGYTT